MQASVCAKASAISRELLAKGVVVVENVVPLDLCEAVVAATAEYVGVGADEPNTWQSRATHGHGIVPLHHHPALWRLREWPGVHELFADLYGSDALWVTMDRVSFKAPASAAEEPPRMSGFHWDADPRRPRAEAGFQGLVYLRDTTAEQGAFCCLPDVYADLEAWLGNRSRKQAATALNSGEERVEAVGGSAGSMVIWHRHMPHSSALNHGNAPRWVQYVTMDPAGEDSVREERIRLFEQKRPPTWAVRQNVPGQQNPEPGPRAKLTALGRRLVGYAT